MKYAAIPLVVLLVAVAVPAATVPAEQPNTEAYELVPIPASAIHHSRGRAPRLREANGTSTNWSGYAIGAGTTTDVQGSWVVPHTAFSGTSTTYSSTWVGIDGYDTSTVEQTGTEDDWTGGSTGGERHYAWFEMYPRGAYLIRNFPVSPGDTMFAEVHSTGSRGNYVLTLSNVTKNATFTKTQKLASAKNGSAEWVVEAPWSGGVLPLANFSTVAFSNCTATIDGHTGGLDDSAWTPDAITMASGSTVKATPSSPLSTNGFTVTWSHE